MIQAEFFLTANGSNPVREWLKEDLTNEQRITVGTHLRFIELHWPVGMPRVRKLDSDLWEARIHIESGITRVLFTVMNSKMILLHGFVKKSQKTPMQDIEVGRKRLSLLKRG